MLLVLIKDDLLFGSANKKLVGINEITKNICDTCQQLIGLLMLWLTHTKCHCLQVLMCGHVACVIAYTHADV